MIDYLELLLESQEQGAEAALSPVPGRPLFGRKQRVGQDEDGTAQPAAPPGEPAPMAAGGLAGVARPGVQVRTGALRSQGRPELAAPPRGSEEDFAAALYRRGSTARRAAGYVRRTAEAHPVFPLAPREHPGVTPRSLDRAFEQDSRRYDRRLTPL